MTAAGHSGAWAWLAPQAEDSEAELQAKQRVLAQQIKVIQQRLYRATRPPHLVASPVGPAQAAGACTAAAAASTAPRDAAARAGAPPWPAAATSAAPGQAPGLAPGFPAPSSAPWPPRSAGAAAAGAASGPGAALKPGAGLIEEIPSSQPATDDDESQEEHQPGAGVARPGGAAPPPAPCRSPPRHPAIPTQPTRHPGIRGTPGSHSSSLQAEQHPSSPLKDPSKPGLSGGAIKEHFPPGVALRPASRAGRAGQGAGRSQGASIGQGSTSAQGAGSKQTSRSEIQATPSIGPPDPLQDLGLLQAPQLSEGAAPCARQGPTPRSTPQAVPTFSIPPSGVPPARPRSTPSPAPHSAPTIPPNPSAAAAALEPPPAAPSRQAIADTGIRGSSTPPHTSPHHAEQQAPHQRPAAPSNSTHAAAAPAGAPPAAASDLSCTQACRATAVAATAATPATTTATTTGAGVGCSGQAGSGLVLGSGSDGRSTSGPCDRLPVEGGLLGAGEGGSEQGAVGVEAGGHSQAGVRRAGVRCEARGPSPVVPQNQQALRGSETSGEVCPATGSLGVGGSPPRAEGPHLRVEGDPVQSLWMGASAEAKVGGQQAGAMAGGAAAGLVWGSVGQLPAPGQGREREESLLDETFPPHPRPASPPPPPPGPSAPPPSLAPSPPHPPHQAATAPGAYVAVIATSPHLPLSRDAPPVPSQANTATAPFPADPGSTPDHATRELEVSASPPGPLDRPRLPAEAEEPLGEARPTQALVEGSPLAISAGAHGPQGPWREPAAASPPVAPSVVPVMPPAVPLVMLPDVPPAMPSVMPPVTHLVMPQQDTSMVLCSPPALQPMHSMGASTPGRCAAAAAAAPGGDARVGCPFVAEVVPATPLSPSHPPHGGGHTLRWQDPHEGGSPGSPLAARGTLLGAQTTGGAETGTGAGEGVAGRCAYGDLSVTAAAVLPPGCAPHARGAPVSPSGLPSSSLRSSMVLGPSPEPAAPWNPRGLFPRGLWLSPTSAPAAQRHQQWCEAMWGWQEAGGAGGLGQGNAGLPEAACMAEGQDGLMFGLRQDRELQQGSGLARPALIDSAGLVRTLGMTSAGAAQEAGSESEMKAAAAAVGTAVMQAGAAGAESHARSAAAAAGAAAAVEMAADAATGVGAQATGDGPTGLGSEPALGPASHVWELELPGAVQAVLDCTARASSCGRCGTPAPAPPLLCLLETPAGGGDARPPLADLPAAINAPLGGAETHKPSVPSSRSPGVDSPGAVGGTHRLVLLPGAAPGASPGEEPSPINERADREPGSVPWLGLGLRAEAMRLAVQRRLALGSTLVCVAGGSTAASVGAGGAAVGACGPRGADGVLTTARGEEAAQGGRALVDGVFVVVARGAWQLEGGDAAAGQACDSQQPQRRKQQQRQRRQQQQQEGGVDVAFLPACSEPGGGEAGCRPVAHLAGPLTALCVLLVSERGRQLVVAAGRGGQAHVWVWEGNTCVGADTWEARGASGGGCVPGSGGRGGRGPGGGGGGGGGACCGGGHDGGGDWLTRPPSASFALPRGCYRGLAVNEVIELRCAARQGPGASAGGNFSRNGKVGGAGGGSAGGVCDDQVWSGQGEGGSVVVGCSSDGTVLVWGLAQRQLLAALHLPMCSVRSIYPVAMGISLPLLGSGSGQGGPGAADTLAGRGGVPWPILCLGRLHHSKAAAGADATKDPDPQTQLSTLQLWPDRAELQPTPAAGPDPAVAAAALGSVTCVAFAGGYAVVGTVGAQVLVWDMVHGGLVAGLDCSTSGPRVAAVCAAATHGGSDEAGGDGARRAGGCGGVLRVVAAVGCTAVVWELRQLR